jgi:hypothetical protein
VTNWRYEKDPPPRAAAAKQSDTQTCDHRADFAVDWAVDWALNDFELTPDSPACHHAPIAAANANRERALMDRGYGEIDIRAAGLGIDEEVPTTVGSAQGIPPAQGRPAANETAVTDWAAVP